MPRFSIRDMFWLTLVAAMGAGWLIHSQKRELEFRREMEKRRMQAHEDWLELSDRCHYLEGELRSLKRSRDQSQAAQH